MLLTLIIIQKENRVLLGMKKKGFGKDRWNGFGGKVEAGESIEEATARELYEECGLKINDFNKVGIIDFEFKGKPELLQVHIFKATDYIGEPIETGEMKPQWFDIDNIPHDKMWPDDKYWLPLFIANKKFRGYFLFSETENDLKIIKNELSEVNNLE